MQKLWDLEGDNGERPPVDIVRSLTPNYTLYCTYLLFFVLLKRDHHLIFVQVKRLQPRVSRGMRFEQNSSFKGIMYWCVLSQKS